MLLKVFVVTKAYKVAQEIKVHKVLEAFKVYKAAAYKVYKVLVEPQRFRVV